jgi:hypothetical protein
MERATAVVSLPHGFLSGGSWVRSAQLRELNGYDEQYLGEIEGLPPPQRTTELLDRVAILGKAPPESNRDLVRHLTAGDRVALLLQLRRRIFGETLECIITCPDCGNEMSLGLAVRDLLQPRLTDARTECEVSVEGLALRIRPVTGEDLEALALATDKESLSEMLVRACILSSDHALPPRLSEKAIAEVSSKLSELDPQADLVLDLTCPACRSNFKAPFFVEDFVLREFRSRKAQLEKEVHWIALNYHWNEDEILSLPMARRKRYVDLINRTLSGEAM